MTHDELYLKISEVIKWTTHTIFIDEEWIFISYTDNWLPIDDFYNRLWKKNIWYTQDEIREIALLPKEELESMRKLVRIKSLREEADKLEKSLNNNK